MAESFLICFGIIAGIALLLAIIMGAVLLRHFIMAAILLLISAGLIWGGLSLLINMGGGEGAFGLFMLLPGAFFGWLGITMVRAGFDEIDRERRR